MSDLRKYADLDRADLFAILELASVEWWDELPFPRRHEFGGDPDEALEGLICLYRNRQGRRT